MPAVFAGVNEIGVESAVKSCVSWPQVSVAQGRNFAKLFDAGAKWCVVTGVLPEGNLLGSLAGQVVAFFKLLEWPKTAYDFFWENPKKIYKNIKDPWPVLNNVIEQGTLIGDGYDQTDAAIKLAEAVGVSVPEAVKEFMKQWAGPVLAMASGLWLLKIFMEIVDLSYAKGDAKRRLAATELTGAKADVVKYTRFVALADVLLWSNAIKVVQWTALAALSAFVIASVFGGVGTVFGVAIGTCILACSTVALIASISSHFYQELVEMPLKVTMGFEQFCEFCRDNNLKSKPVPVQVV